MSEESASSFGGIVDGTTSFMTSVGGMPSLLPSVGVAEHGGSAIGTPMSVPASGAHACKVVEGDIGELPFTASSRGIFGGGPSVVAFEDDLALFVGATLSEVSVPSSLMLLKEATCSKLLIENPLEKKRSHYD